jgi:aldose 1-epimerase
MPRIITLSDDTGLTLRLLDVGATWWSLTLQLPGEALPRELLLGGRTPAEQIANSAFFGATIGRVANRIALGRLSRGGRSWSLAVAPGARHHLHGGPDGFDKRRWTVLGAQSREARLALHSPGGDNGYPGAVDAEVALRLPGGGVVEQSFSATCTEPTPLCMTNHAYFNLDGHEGDVRSHWLQLAASRYLPVDDELIPLGRLEDVAGSEFDFRARRRVGRPGAVGAAGGVVDHAFVLDSGCAAMVTDAATLVSADGRLQLGLATTMPALQLYTGQQLGRERNRSGGPMQAYAGLALEPEWLPDSVNHPEWPQPPCWLEPGQRWAHRIRYAFSHLAGDGA